MARPKKLTANDLGDFVRQYGRKAPIRGEPNDRDHDKSVQKLIDHAKPELVDQLLREGEDALPSPQRKKCHASILVLRIAEWNSAGAVRKWTPTDTGVFEGLLQSSTSLKVLAIKRMARQVRDGQCLEIILDKLSNEFSSTRFRNFLEERGAVIFVAK